MPLQQQQQILSRKMDFDCAHQSHDNRNSSQWWSCFFAASFSLSLALSDVFVNKRRTLFSPFVGLKWSATVCPFVYMSVHSAPFIYKDSNSTGRWITFLLPSTTYNSCVCKAATKANDRNEATIHWTHISFYLYFFLLLFPIIFMLQSFYAIHFYSFRLSTVCASLGVSPVEAFFSSVSLVDSLFHRNSSNCCRLNAIISHFSLSLSLALYLTLESGW